MGTLHVDFNGLCLQAVFILVVHKQYIHLLFISHLKLHNIMTAAELRALIVDAIGKKHMTISEFANSDIPGKIGLKAGNTLRCYLQGNSISIDVFEKLVQYFKLGKKLERKMFVEKVTDYALDGTGMTYPKKWVEGASPKEATRPIAKKSPVKKAAVKKAPAKKSAPVTAPRKIAAVPSVKSVLSKSLKKAPAKKLILANSKKRVLR